MTLGAHSLEGSQLDSERIAMLRSIRNGALLQKVVQSYMADSPPQVTAFLAALGVTDAVAALRVAHALKSASFSIGAKHVGAICEHIEQSLRQGATLDVAAVSAMLSASHTAVIAELGRLLHT